MIALMVMGAFLVYILISLLVIWVVYKKYKTKKALFIALLVMILIPTWDVIIGKPIYNYLCKNKAGVHIYKTVDNVEGFYIGEKNKYGNPSIVLPYKGYKFVDYKDGKDGKYYRNQWLDSNTSKECVSYKGAWNYDYTQAFKNGKCIIKKEIPKKEVSGLWETKKEVEHYNIFYLNIDKVKFTILNRKTKEKYFTIIDFFVDKSWITGALNFVSGNKGRYNCFPYEPYNNYTGVVDTTSGFEIGKTFVLKNLQSKKEGK